MQRNRPRVTVNVAATADGKLAPVDRGLTNFGGAEDRALMEQLRAAADAVLIGSGTLKAEDPPLLILNLALREARQAQGGGPHPLNVTVCSRLPATLAEMRFFLHPETEKLVFTSVQTPPELRALAARYAAVEVVPLDAAGHLDLAEVMHRLAEKGVQNLLLEGGGELNFSMLAAGLVDELYLTVCPLLFGGRTAPTPFDGEGLPTSQVRRLDLLSYRPGHQGQVFLHYRLQSPDANLAGHKNTDQDHHAEFES